VDPDYVIGRGVIVQRASEDLVSYLMLVNVIGRLLQHTFTEIEKHLTQPG
jgi:hypothetical protein